MGVEMKIWRSGPVCIEHGRSHQPPPEQRSPVTRPRPERGFVEQTVVAGSEGVVHHYLDAGLRQASELVEIAERVEKRPVPSVAAAGRISRLSQPDRLARLECVAQRLVGRACRIRACQPSFRERLRRIIVPAAARRDRVVVVIGEAVDPRTGCSEQIARGDARPGWRWRVANGAWTEDQGLRRLAPHPVAEDLEVAAIGGRVIAGGCAVGRCERRLVHEFGGGDAAAQRARGVDELLRLIRFPHAIGIAAARTDRKRGDDLGIDRARELDDAAPLVVAEDGVEPRRRLSRRVGQERRIGPGAAHAQIGRRQGGGEQAQACIGQIDRRSCAVTIPLVEGPCRSRIGLPEPSAGHLHHFDVVGLKARIDRSDRLQFRRHDGPVAGARRAHRCGCEQRNRQRACRCATGWVRSVSPAVVCGPVLRHALPVRMHKRQPWSLPSSPIYLYFTPRSIPGASGPPAAGGRGQGGGGPSAEHQPGWGTKNLWQPP